MKYMKTSLFLAIGLLACSIVSVGAMQRLDVSPAMSYELGFNQVMVDHVIVVDQVVAKEDRVFKNYLHISEPAQHYVIKTNTNFGNVHSVWSQTLQPSPIRKTEVGWI